MVKIDAHQHFWKYDYLKHEWINEEMAVIRRDFLPENLLPVLQEHGIDGCIAVQADQTEAETIFLLQLAKEHDFIKGVVGWVDLQCPAIEEWLRHFSRNEKFKGVRHILQGETQRDLMLDKAFLNGISKLQQFDLSYDILIFPDQLKYVPELVSAFPDLRFVIDHIAKPDIKNKVMGDWKKELEQIAQHENVHCKLSGMVTEADLKSWKADDFTPYLDTVVEAFGISRILYGSDWPVCLSAGSYSDVMGIVANYFSRFTAREQQLFFGENASAFYRLS